MKTNVSSYTDIQLIARVEALPSFTGWQKGKYDIWVRSTEDAFDLFDDKVYSFHCKKEGERPVFFMVCSGTSNAGAQGLKYFDTYNKLGCAVLKADVIVYNSHQYGLHKRKTPAYVQRKGFPYFRDADKDEFAEQVGIEYSNVIGANCHPAGVASKKNGGWSVACLVRNIRAEYDKWLRWMNEEPLSVAILTEFEP